MLFRSWLGVVLPVLPTTPFLLLAAYFLAKGSTKFHIWFTNTSLYKNHLHSFVETRSMTLKTKVCILIPASMMMLIALYFVPITAVKYLIVGLIIFKYYYFARHIKTIRNPEDRRAREKRVVGEMVYIYCRGHKHIEQVKGEKRLCPECEALLNYADMRTDKCPFMETKTFCSNCKVHCYKPEQKEQIKAVMRYAGPRMITYHPYLAISHVIASTREKRKLEEKYD